MQKGNVDSAFKTNDCTLPCIERHEEVTKAPRWASSVNSIALLTPTNQSLSKAVGFGDDKECKLLDCGPVSPTCATKPDNPRMEFDDFRAEAARLANEFFCARDLRGMISSIVAMESQCFHDELVAVLLRSSLDRKESERNAVVSLLRMLFEENIISSPQLTRGFEKLVLIWEDLRLDIPDVAAQLACFLSVEVGLLDIDFFKRLPEGLLEAVCTDFDPGASCDTLKAYVQELRTFKRDIAARLENETVRSFNCDEFIKSVREWLQSMEMAAFHHEVVLAACISIVTARNDKKCMDQLKIVFEMFVRLSGASSSFCGISDCANGDQLLTEADFQIGFSRLLGQIPELTKASPDAMTRTVNLLRCAVEQKVLPADFLKTSRRLRFGGPQGVQVLREALRQTPAFSRRVWGSGDKRQLQKETQETIFEYFDSGNIEEMGQIVGELHLSDKEIIKFLRTLLVSGMERGKSEKSLDAVKALMGFFWSEADVESAFDELQGMADDLVLDFPQCRESTQALMQTAHGRGILETSYLKTICISAV